MLQFITSVIRSNQVNDGTRRRALEMVQTARQDLTDASSKLSDTISDLLRENDKITKRQHRHGKVPDK